MDKFFSLFGKSVLVILILGSIAYGAYSYGKMTSPDTKPTAASTTATPTTPPSIEGGLMPEKKPETTGTTKTTIFAGLGNESGLSFTKYQLSVPTTWTPLHQTENNGWMDVLTLTKGTTQLKISQGATGGAMCVYPGDTTFEGPSSTYDSFVVITTADGITLRRGTTLAGNGTTKAYTMCQKGTDSYGQPTVFGHMSLKTDASPSASLMLEVDAMIASLKKLQ